MKFELFPGVRVNFIKNDQFKSIQVMVSFIKKLTDKKQLSGRTLLASVLETASQKYPNQHAITLKLAELYGATFGTNAEVEGNLSLLNFIYSFVVPEYLPNKTDILGNSIEFLNEMIFHPKMDGQLFDEQLFMRQKENLATYIRGIQDNKQSEALLEIQKLYFDDEIQKYTPYGHENDFKAFTNEELIDVYQQMIKEDNVEITIMGNLDVSKLKTALKKFEFGKRTKSIEFEKQICYHQNINKIRTKEIEEPVRQSKLDLIYQLPINAQAGSKFFSAVVFNAMLGGSPQSKLFKNIREKESLAYYADSSYSALRSIVLIQTGIQAENREKVKNLIQSQVESLKNGNFTDSELQKIKIELINERLRMQDNPLSILDQQVLGNILNQNMSYEFQCDSIQRITRQDIIKVANLMKFQTEFFLKGEV